MIRKKCLQAYCVLQWVLLSATSYANVPLGYGGGGNQARSIGELSERIMAPATGLERATELICYVLGVGMLTGSLLQYRRHRQNPSEVRLSGPVLLLILGFLLVIFPWLARYSFSAGYFPK